MLAGENAPFFVSVNALSKMIIKAAFKVGFLDNFKIAKVSFELCRKILADKMLNFIESDLH